MRKNPFLLSSAAAKLIAALMLLLWPVGPIVGASAANQTTVLAQASEKAEGQGVVKAINTEERQIRIAHEPIASLGWPAMVMPFSVAPNVDLGALSPGTKVTFTLSKGASGYVIEDIRPAK